MKLGMAFGISTVQTDSDKGKLEVEQPFDLCLREKAAVGIEALVELQSPGQSHPLQEVGVVSRLPTAGPEQGYLFRAQLSDEPFHGGPVHEGGGEDTIPFPKRPVALSAAGTSRNGIDRYRATGKGWPIVVPG